ncbi:hypothetical protein, partial [Bacteroides heparinolyticus]|uniref:hypothetical protein n=1 Tax=Prevotella heparinolytica TaxID=28113 RepID=UPI0028E9D1AE
FIFSVFIRFNICGQNYPNKSVPHLRRKLPTEATATRTIIIQLPISSPSLPTSKQGNTLVTELLPKSAYFCPLQIEQYYADLCISSSLSVSLRQLLYFFIFID